MFGNTLRSQRHTPEDEWQEWFRPCGGSRVGIANMYRFTWEGTGKGALSVSLHAVQYSQPQLLNEAAGRIPGIAENTRFAQLFRG